MMAKKSYFLFWILHLLTICSLFSRAPKRARKWTQILAVVAVSIGAFIHGTTGYLFSECIFFLPQKIIWSTGWKYWPLLQVHYLLIWINKRCWNIFFFINKSSNIWIKKNFIDIIKKNCRKKIERILKRYVKIRKK